MKTKIETIIAEELPGFWFRVSPYRFLSREYLAVMIAAKDYLINGVANQRPQAVSFSLDPVTFELITQGFGGSGGSRIYRDPDLTKDNEKFLCMVGVRVPFRTPKRGEKFVLAAIRRFCIAYRKTLRDNVKVLRYRDIIDYSDLLYPRLKPTQKNRE